MSRAFLLLPDLVLAAIPLPVIDRDEGESLGAIPAGVAPGAPATVLGPAQDDRPGTAFLRGKEDLGRQCVTIAQGEVHVLVVPFAGQLPDQALGQVLRVLPMRKDAVTVRVRTRVLLEIAFEGLVRLGSTLLRGPDGGQRHEGQVDEE